MDKRIPLSMSAAELKDQPVIGYLAVICGVLAIFAWGIVFVPMGIAFSVAAMIAGQGAWGFAGLVLSVIGLMTSPTLLTLLGMGAIAAYFGFG